MMKTTKKNPIQELRKIIGLTQTEFAALIGASKDAVVSWEIGRNKLSPPFARRIAFATGVEERALRRRGGDLMVQEFLGSRPYTKEEYENYRKTHWGRSDEEAAQAHLKDCKDTLELIFLAAAKPGGGKIRNRLPAVLDAFSQWCEEVRADFRLGPQIQELLAKRTFKVPMTLTYKALRGLEQEDPEAASLLRFKDDKRKGDGERMDLMVEAIPGWAPCQGMQPPKPLITEIQKRVG